MDLLAASQRHAPSVTDPLAVSVALGPENFRLRPLYAAIRTLFCPHSFRARGLIGRAVLMECRRCGGFTGKPQEVAAMEAIRSHGLNVVFTA